MENLTVLQSRLEKQAFQVEKDIENINDKIMRHMLQSRLEKQAFQARQSINFYTSNHI